MKISECNMNIAENIIKKNTENINTKDVDVVPCGRHVIYEKYQENPYRLIETSENGVIFGIEGQNRYIADDSGEMTSNKEVIMCAKIIATGPDCKYVHVGDDVFVYGSFGTPIPFRKKGWYMIDEMNVLCIMKEKC